MSHFESLFYYFAQEYSSKAFLGRLGFVSIVFQRVVKAAVKADQIQSGGEKSCFLIYN